MKSMSPKKLFSCVGQAHEFELAMIKAGVKASQIQDVINGRLKLNLSPIGNFVENKYLNLISGSETLIIDQCDGKRNIYDASEAFDIIDRFFRNWKVDEAGHVVPDTPVSVFELKKDGVIDDIAGSLSVEKDNLCLTQDQIIGFVKKYFNWLRKDGCNTFFLFKSFGDFLVANVYFGPRGFLCVSGFRLKDNISWRCVNRHRFVFPQPVALTIRF